MAIIEGEFDTALGGSVKRKRNATKKISSPRAKAKRVAAGAPEVMVKVTGFAKGARHVKSHLDYISRNGKIELETEQGQILSGREDVKDLFKGWSTDMNQGKRHAGQRDTMSVIFSMPEGTMPEDVRDAARAFARDTFGKTNQYVFALHTDEPHPHVHLTVKCKGYDGRMLQVAKGDPQIWRETFAEKLRSLGVEAEATPRQTRGVVKKAESNVVRHIERGDATHPPRVPVVTARKTRQAAQELAAEAKGTPTPPKPWEAPIAARQQAIRQAWLNAADALERENTTLTFNGKEQKNVRPNYAGIDRRAARAGQRAAAVYQSDPSKSGQAAPARSVAGLRNVSRLDVVQHSRSPKVLLQPNARHRMGRDGRPDPDLRRSGTRVNGPGSQAERVSGYQATARQNQALAGRIRAFVEAMPAIETAGQEMKRDLAQRFTKQPERQANTRRGIRQVDPGQEQKNSADRSAPVPKDKDKDLDR